MSPLLNDEEIPLIPAPFAEGERLTKMSNGRAVQGLMLGQLQLIQSIGVGGMGEVWKAHNAAANLDMVVKMLPREYEHNPAEMARLRDSFRRVIELPHPNICPVYQFELDPRYGPYLVMKFIAGITLTEYRQQCGTLRVTDMMRILKPIAVALDYAHSKNVIHRDIKPDNILIHADGTDPQIIDFGLAVEIQRSLSRVGGPTKHDNSGTLAYMAPEQLRARPQDGKSDQYALAVIAYELLMGTLPFDSPSEEILIRSVLNEEPPELPGDANLTAVFRQALAKVGSKRYPSCVAMLDAIANPPKAVPIKANTAMGPKSRSPWPVVIGVAAMAALGWYFIVKPAVIPTTPPVVANSIPEPPPVVTPTPVPYAPPQQSPPIVLPTLTPGALTAEQKTNTRQILEAQVATIQQPIQGWRDKLSNLQPPDDTPNTAVVHKTLVQAQNAFDAFASKTADISTAVKISPLATSTDVDALSERIRNLDVEPQQGKTLPQWRQTSEENFSTFTKLIVVSTAKIKSDRNVLLDQTRTTAEKILRTVEAADTQGYDPGDSEALLELRKTWLPQRKKLRELVSTVERIQLELRSAVPPDRKRLDELQVELVDLSKDVADDSTIQQTRQIAQLLKQNAQAQAAAFATRKTELSKAHNEAQWFICTDDRATPFMVEGATERGKMTQSGLTPGTGPSNDQTKHIDDRLPFFHRDADKVQKTTNWRDANSGSSYIPQFDYGFVLYAGKLRQQFVPYSEEFPDKIKAKREEMQTALAKILNGKFGGLDLKPNEIDFRWQRANGDEKAVSVKNYLGGFKVAVKIPIQPAPGLMGEGDPEFKVLIADAQRLATGTAAPMVLPAIAGNSTWKGTLTQDRNDSNARCVFASVRQGIVKGTLNWAGSRSNDGQVSFTGVLSPDNELTFVTHGPVSGNNVVTGFQYQGKIANGRFTGTASHPDRNTAISFDLARE